MCKKSACSDHQEEGSMYNKETSFPTTPARRTRTRTRKPKFLSLRRELSDENSQESSEMTDRHNQLNLFPLHSENLFEEKEIQDENMAYFFYADSGATLNGLLDGKGGGGGSSSVLYSEEDSFSPTLRYAYAGQDSDEGTRSQLVRTALRNKERDDSEEKWVFYSEVVERKEEEVSSCAYACAADVRDHNQTTPGLSLKLDYQEILNAWSDKAPLYIDGGECPQIVPDVQDDCQAQDSNNVLMDVGCGRDERLWRVPEKEEEGSSVSNAVEEVVMSGEGWKLMGQREARVLRYKEKRQSRLFSKKIRYQVRKLNAEKRPRIKGRFVKRS